MSVSDVRFLQLCGLALVFGGMLGEAVQGQWGHVVLLLVVPGISFLAGRLLRSLIDNVAAYVASKREQKRGGE